MNDLALLINYKYLVLSLLAILEGPVLSLVSGFLIRIGYFKFLPVIIVLVAGDIISDTIYYFLAVKSNGEKYIKKYGKKYKSISENFNLLSSLWKQHGRITMFFGKFAYGFTAPLVISAALSKISYKRLMAYIIPPTVIKYCLLVAVGYYFAGSYKSAEKYIYLSAIYVPVIIFSFIFSYKLIIKYLKNKAGKPDKDRF